MEICQVKKHPGKYQSLYQRIRPYRRRIILSLSVTAIFTGLTLLSPLLMRFMIDKVIEPRSWRLLPFALAAIFLVPVVTAGMRYVNNHLIMLTTRRFIADIRLAMYRKILHLSLRYHGDHAPGMLVGRLMDDINVVQRLVTGDTVQLVVDIVVFFFALSILFSLSWKLALIISGTLVLYAVAYRLFADRIRNANEVYRNIYDEISGRLQETLAGVRHVRIYNQEDQESERFLNQTARGLDQLFLSSMSSTGLGMVTQSVAAMGSIAVVTLGAFYVLRGEMSYGDLYAFDTYVWWAINPIIRLTTVFAQMNETFVSVRRVVEVLDEPMDIVSPPSAPALPRGPGAVRFEDVDFSYAPDKPLYRKLSLEVPAGKTVALVGQTGCGKSTLTLLLMRYWDVQAGRITIDGADISRVSVDSLRRQFGVVLQHPVLFEGTLAENIAYGEPGASRERIIAAAQMAEVHDLALRLPKGYDTIIGTGGVKLSLGEKQRVSIARAILKDPMILIMDEATSSLDSESEMLIQKALRRVLKGRTGFVVAHRLSTIVQADLIVVMDHGRIVEQGTHHELLAMPGGLYQSYIHHLMSQQQDGGHES